MKKYLILALTLILFQCGFSQVPFFITPPNAYITESGYSGNCIAPLTMPTSTHQVANAYWDESWELRFMVINDTIFDHVGTYLSYVNGYTSPTVSSQNEFLLPWLSGMNDDIVIIPKPGVCKHIYAIYSVPSSDGLYSGVLYTEVDISGGTPSVVSLSSAPSASPSALVSLGTYSGLPELAGLSYGTGLCLAASKPYDSNNDRILYAVNGYGSVYSVPVTSSGFGTATLVTSTTLSTPAYVAQMKLRSDGALLGYAISGSTGGTLYQVGVNPSTGALSGTPSAFTLPTGVTHVYGLEFLDGTDGAMILTTDNGIYSFYMSGSTPTWTQVYTGSYKTQIDYCASGYFYFANNSGTLKKIANVFSGIVPGFTMSDANNPGYPSLTIYSNSNLEPDEVVWDVYSLPNEVDGDNYSYFTGVNKTTCNFQINSVAPTSVCADIQQVYNCNAITLTNLSTGAESYTLTVNSINGTCGVVSGSGYLTYSSGTITTLPTDLRSMPGTNGTWLASHPGSYEVTLTANNACGDNGVVSTYINVNASPGSTGAVIGINDPITGNPCYTSSQGSPCALCSGTPTMNLASSTGTITYYTKSVYENISGTWTLEYASGSTPGPLGTGIYVGCDGPDVNCTVPTAWSLSAQYYVQVTVGNACGSNSSTAYFQFDNCKWDGASGINNIDDISMFNTYPNPFNDKVDFQLTVAKATQISIKLYDVTGRLVNGVAPKLYNEGEHLTTIETGGLSNGVYIYELVADDKTYTGKLVKTQ